MKIRNSARLPTGLAAHIMGMSLPETSMINAAQARKRYFPTRWEIPFVWLDDNGRVLHNTTVAWKINFGEWYAEW